MTTTKDNVEKKDRSRSFNRILYGGLIGLSVYFFFSKDFGSAMANLGIALAFDPFDQKVSWTNRPSYQRAWLIVHVSTVFFFAGMLVIRSLM